LATHFTILFHQLLNI
jgi:hypothetical protein